MELYMKKFLISVSMIVLAVAMLFSLSACTNDEVYTKADVDAFVAQLEAALAQKADATETAIVTLKADYDAKIEELEEENALLEASLESANSENAAAIQAAINQNEAKITALQAEMESEIAAVQNEYTQKLAEVSSVISALEKAGLSYAARIAILESQIAELLSAHQHKCGAWVDYSGNGNISCENRLYYRVCSECNMLEWKKGSEEDHIYGTTYDFVDDYHWQICTVCGDSSDKASHNMDENQKCTDCGMGSVQGWLLTGIPAYEGGTPASSIYLAGQGYASDQALENEDLMQAVSATSSSEFKAYLAKLQKAGYTQEFYREADTNLFASYIKGSVRVYAYFMSRTGEARIVKEDANLSISLSEIESHVKKPGEQTVFYQYALEMADEKHTKADGYKDTGMLHIIKLPDNSLIIIDGGQYNQLGSERRDALMKFLREITGTTNEKIRIAAWFITHAHGDHHVGLTRFFDAYHSQFQLDLVMWAFPSFNSSYTTFTDQTDTFSWVKNCLNNYFEDTPFLKLHTGQTFNIADVSFEVIYTQEDGVDAATGETKITDFNDTSTVIRLTIDGATFMILGDSHEKCAQPTIIANWSAEYLKSDGMQLAHHGMYNLQKLYKIIKAEVIFVPQSEYAIESVELRKNTFAVAKQYAREDMIFFQNEAVVGIAVVDGKWELAYYAPFEVHKDANKDLICDVCGDAISVADTVWPLEGVPEYNGGTLAGSIYLAGQGYASEQLVENENILQAISGTNANEFQSYLTKLVANGFTREFYREEDTNLFASYIKGSVRVYAYFMSRTGEARIVKEDANMSASLSDFSYTYTPKAGEQSVIYQFAVEMADETHTKDDGYKNNGMLYIIKLADNSVVIIDGAQYNQFPDARRKALLSFLREITGTPTTEKIRIAAWYLTHAHSDHHAGMRRFFDAYHAQLDLERVVWGFPSFNLDHEEIAGQAAEFGRITTVINNYYTGDDAPMFLRLHTGQVFTLADVSFEILYSHEDGVDATTGITKISDFNDTSTVARVTIGGQTMIFLADSHYKCAEPTMMKNWSAEYLKSDAMQLAHHGLYELDDIYKLIKAEIVFVPQSEYAIETVASRKAALDVARSYVRNDMIFFQNEATVGIAVVDGKWEVVYNDPFVY